MAKSWQKAYKGAAQHLRRSFKKAIPPQKPMTQEDWRAVIEEEGMEEALKILHREVRRA